MIHHLPQGNYWDDLQVWYEHCFPGIHRGDVDPPEPLLAAGHGHRQHAPNMPDCAIQGKLTHHDRIGHCVRRQLAGGDQDTQRDRQIIGRPLFADIGRRKIDHHPPARKVQPRVFYGRLDPFPALLKGVA